MCKSVAFRNIELTPTYLRWLVFLYATFSAVCWGPCGPLTTQNLNFGDTLANYEIDGMTSTMFYLHFYYFLERIKLTIVLLLLDCRHQYDECYRDSVFRDELENSDEVWALLFTTVSPSEQKRLNLTLHGSHTQSSLAEDFKPLWDELSSSVKRVRVSSCGFNIFLKRKLYIFD
jgi:hypothetical protein